MKKFHLIVMLLLINLSISQNINNINNHKYVIIPEKFEYFKEPNKYNLNALTKMVLEKYGFEVYYLNSSIPTELLNNRCRALLGDLIVDNSFLITKVKIILKDCKENILYQTEFGKSREKDLNKAYNLAFREAAKSFETLQYKYVENENETNVEESKDIYSLETSPDTPELFFFAQPIANGFQVVNSEPRVIMRLFKTSQNQVFIAVKGDQNGVVISKNGKWFFEYYENSKLVSELINLRF